jgi:hypothetical protein
MFPAHYANARITRTDTVCVKRTRQTILEFKRTRQTNKITLSVKQTNPCVCVRLFSDHPGYIPLVVFCPVSIKRLIDVAYLLP